MSGPRVAVLDNYDSFTFNLVQLLAELGAPPAVYRNDAVTVEELAGHSALVVSPGPGTPTEAGVSVEAIRELGLVRGSIVGGWRLLRCNPLSRGGYDPLERRALFRVR